MFPYEQNKNDNHNNVVGFLATFAMSFFCGFMIGGFLAPPVTYVSQELNYGFVDKPWIDEYQTLVGSFLGGAIAFLAAFLAWSAVQSQIRSDRDADEETIRRKVRSAKSLMPISLASLQENVVQISKTLTEIVEDQRVFGDVRAKLIGSANTILADRDSFLNLKDVIESIDNDQSRYLSVFVSFMQAIISRVKHFCVENSVSTPLRRNELANLIIDCAAIVAYSDSLFPYARGSTSSMNPSIDLGAIRSVLEIWSVAERVDEFRIGGLEKYTNPLEKLLAKFSPAS